MMRRSKEEEALLSQIANAEAKLHGLREKLKEERIRLAGVSVGDVVIGYRSGEEFEVRQIEPNSWGKPRLLVAKRKKDGTFGNVLTSLYDWRQAQKEQR